MEFNITVPGIPVAKGRPKVSRYGTYTPKKTADYESYVEFCWASEYGNIKPSDKPLKVALVFFMPIPKNETKKNKEKIEEGTYHHTKRPDLDNMAKSVLDALNGLAYNDDSQIYSLTAAKFYDEFPRAEITLTETE